MNHSFTPVEERFERHYITEPNSGCWLWTASTMGGDYGAFMYRKSPGDPFVKKYAHRVSYEMHVGPIPSGKVIDHICRTPCCVNPRHLRAITQRENTSPPNAIYPARRQLEVFCANGHRLSEHGGKRKGEYGDRQYCKTCRAAYAKRKYQEKKQQ